jgi:hypothetical protein
MVNFVGTVADVTERKEREEKEHLLMREVVDHEQSYEKTSGRHPSKRDKWMLCARQIVIAFHTVVSFRPTTLPH